MVFLPSVGLAWDPEYGGDIDCYYCARVCCKVVFATVVLYNKRMYAGSDPALAERTHKEIDWPQ